MRDRLEKADAAMRNLYLTLQAGDDAAVALENIDVNGCGFLLLA